MSLSRSDVEKIAHLARLAISEDDVPAYARELSNILDLVEQMSSVDTEAVQRTRAHNALRQRKADEAFQSWLRQLRDESYVEYRLEG